MRIWIAPFAASLALGLASTPAFAGKENGTLRWASDSEPASLDAYYDGLRETIVLSRHIFDQLVWRDPATGEYVPHLAESVAFRDPKTIEVNLRQGITFHNGEPFDADDVVHTLNYISDPENKIIVGSRVFWLDRAEKTGEHSLLIHMKDAFPPALEYLSALVMYPDEYYAEVGPEGMGKAPVGTGPYRVEEFVPGQRIVLAKNEDYFGGAKGQPSIGRLIFRPIPDRSTQIAEMLAGGLDWIWRVPRDQAQDLERQPGLAVLGGETMRVGYITMDAAGRSGENPFEDERVRRAVSHAIDREAIVDNLVGGGARVVHAACSPTQFGCVEEQAPRYEYDPEKARALLAEAGHPDGFEIDIHAYRERPYVEAMIGYLREVGIEANLQWMQYKALQSKLREGGVAFTYMTDGFSSVADASVVSRKYFTGGQDDLSRDDEVKALLDEADNAVDPEVRRTKYAEAFGLIAERAYWLPMFTYSTFYAFTDELDFEPRADEIPRFYMSEWQ